MAGFMDRLKRLKKNAGDLLPDEIDDALDRARRFGGEVVPDEQLTEVLRDARNYLSNPRRALGDAARRVSEQDTLGPRSSLKDLKRASDVVYRDVLDPAKEFVTIGLETEGLGDFRRELRAKERAHGYEGGNPFDKVAALGRAWRDRDDTLAKRIVDATVDPANVIPVAGTLAKAKAAGQPITRALVRSALRELAAPAAAQFGGAHIGEAIGGERGARIGETLGLLGGGVGPNLVRRTPDAASASTIVETSDTLPRTRSAIRDSLAALKTPSPGSPSALAVQGFGTAAGAVGGYQATEGEDPRTRLLATLGGGVAGYGLGRRVAQGKPIGLAIEDMGERWRQIDELRDAAHAAEVAGDVARATDVRQQANALRDQIEQTLATEASSGGLRSLVGGLFGRRGTTEPAALPGVEDINPPPTRQPAQARIAAPVGDVPQAATVAETAPAVPPAVQKRTLIDTLVGGAGMTADVAQQGMLSLDIGQPMRITPAAWLMTASAGKPLAGLTAAGRALKGAVDPAYAREYLSSAKATRWRGLAVPEDMIQPEFTDLFQRAPVLKQTVGALENAQFNRFTPILAIETADAVYSGLRKSRGLRHLSDAEAMQQIGTFVRQGLIGRPVDEVTQSKTLQAILRRSFLSPRWTAGTIANLGAVARPGPQGDIARRFWATTAFTAVALPLAWNVGVNGDDPRELLDPTHPNSMINPRQGRDFLAFRGKDGTRVSPFQSIMPVVRLVLRPAVAGGEAAYETLGEDDASWYDAIRSFVTAGREEGRTALTQYFLGRASTPIRLFNDLVITGEDFYGNPIMTKEGIGGLGQAAAYAVRENVPIVAQPLTERVERIPGTAPSARDQLVEVVTGFLGLNVRPGDRLPTEAAHALRAELQARGVQPSGADADLLRQFSGLNLDDDEKSAFYRANPSVRKYLDDRTRIYGERFETPTGRAAIDLYRGESQVLREARDRALTQLEQEGVTGDEYRRRRQIVMTRYRERLGQVQMMAFGSDDPQRVDAAFDAVYRNDREAGPVRKALDGLYAIRQEDDSSAARDEYFRRRDEYLASLSPEMREKLFQRQINDAPTDTERRYLHAQRLMSSWYDIPKYRSFVPQEDARAVDAALARARDLQTYTGAPLKRTLILDKDTDPRIKMLALRVVKAGGKAYNPTRRTYLRDNPMLASFFSSLSAEMAAQLIEPGADLNGGRHESLHIAAQESGAVGGARRGDGAD